MKRTISDCSMGWGYLDEGPQKNITHRLARSVVGMHGGINEDAKLPFDLPSLLHFDPDSWPLDSEKKGIDASLMPLNKPSIRVYVHAEDEGPSKKHWVGSNGEWIAFAHHPGHWYIQNSNKRVDIPMPPVERVGIKPVQNNWLRRPPFSYEYKLARIKLLQIQITSEPFMRGEEWHFSAIAVFDKFIAVIHMPHDTDWVILRNDYLAPATYVNAIATNMYNGKDERIYAIIAPRGDVLVWELFKFGRDAGPRVIHAPVLEEDPTNVQAGGGVGDDASRSWYLARMPGMASIMWINSSREREAIGGPISYKGRELRSYPSVRCHVFTRSCLVLDDPVAPDWIRADNLEGKSVFVGINYHFFFDTPAASSEPPDDAAIEHESLPIFKPDCVFATHIKCQQYPQPSPDWIRMHVNDGEPAAIGSSLNNEHGWRLAEAANRDLMFKTPMWFLATPKQPWSY